MKVFYNWLKEVYGPLQIGTTQLTALDGETVKHEKPEILDGFANHFDQLLNISKEVDRPALDTIAQWPNSSFLDEKSARNCWMLSMQQRRLAQHNSAICWISSATWRRRESMSFVANEKYIFVL